MRDNHCQIAISTDGGYTNGDWTIHHRGEVGEFEKNIVTRRRLGQARDFRMSVRDTSPVVADLIAVEIDPE